MAEKYDRHKTTLFLNEKELHLLFSMNYKEKEKEDIGLVRERYNNLKLELDTLTAKLGSDKNFIKIEQERLKSMTGELALSESEKRELRNELFRLRKELERLDDAKSVTEEYDRQEVQLNDLTEKEQTLNREITEFDSKHKEYTELVKKMETRLNEVSHELTVQEPEKGELTKEVSYLGELSEIFVERENLESETKSLNETLKEREQEREKLKNIISDFNVSIPETKSEIESLEKRVVSLEKMAKEVESLLSERSSTRKEVEELEAEFKPLNEKVESLRSEFADKEEKLESLKQANKDMKETIAYTENGIAQYDSTLTEIRRAKERQKESDKQNEAVIDGLSVLFSEKARVDQELSLFEEIINTIEAVK